jgi:signal transduction histidine kinase
LGVQDDRVILTIEDQGRGIAPEDIERVCERFVQIDRGQFEQQGAGLGLALVRDGVRLHQGTCSIESEPGQGTRVTLTLPLAP